MAAYTVADITGVKKRVISILNAYPGVWSATVSGDVGAFPSDPEILAAILEADSLVCVEGYFQSANDAMANHFGVTSAPLGDADNIPWHKGTLNKVEVSTGTNNFTLTSANTFTATAHGWTTGQLVSLINVGGALPTGLSTLTNYYVIRLTANTFSLATSLANALAGSAIAVAYPGGAGTGTHTAISWAIGVEAKNIDDITNAIAVSETYVGTGTFDFLYKENSGVIYTPATYARVTYPEYTSNGATLQANQNETSAVVFTAVAILMKNASPAPFEYYNNLSQMAIKAIVEDSVFTAQTTEQNIP